LLGRLGARLVRALWVRVLDHAGAGVAAAHAGGLHAGGRESARSAGSEDS